MRSLGSMLSVVAYTYTVCRNWKCFSFQHDCVRQRCIWFCRSKQMNLNAAAVLLLDCGWRLLSVSCRYFTSFCMSHTRMGRMWDCPASIIMELLYIMSNTFVPAVTKLTPADVIKPRLQVVARRGQNIFSSVMDEKLGEESMRLLWMETEGTCTHAHSQKMKWKVSRLQIKAFKGSVNCWEIYLRFDVKERMNMFLRSGRVSILTSAEWFHIDFGGKLQISFKALFYINITALSLKGFQISRTCRISNHEKYKYEIAILDYFLVCH